MAKIDEIKELINTLRVYLGFLLAIILSLGAGIAKLYISKNVGLLFYLGVLIIFIVMIGFIINNRLHKEIKKLKDL